MLVRQQVRTTAFTRQADEIPQMLVQGADSRRLVLHNYAKLGL